MAVNKVKEIGVDMLDAAKNEDQKEQTLRRLAATAMNSKLIKRNTEFFTKSKSTALCVCLGRGKADSMVN